MLPTTRGGRDYCCRPQGLQGILVGYYYLVNYIPGRVEVFLTSTVLHTRLILGDHDWLAETVPNPSVMKVSRYETIIKIIKMNA